MIEMGSNNSFEAILKEYKDHNMALGLSFLKLLMVLWSGLKPFNNHINSIFRLVSFSSPLDCAYATACKGKSYEKRVTVTYYKPEYERAIERVESSQGRYMKKKRQSAVEPVFGTLSQFMGLRKVNTRGIRQANKIMLMAAVAYNIKKYLKFTLKVAQIGVKSIGNIWTHFNTHISLILLNSKLLINNNQSYKDDICLC